MKTILVTTDLSAKSKAGLRFAIQMASQTKASIMVCHIAELLKPTSWSDARFKQFSADKIKEVTDTVNKLLAQESDPVTIKKLKCTIVVEFGINVPETIMTCARKHKASYICMSSRGAGQYEKLLGTVASELITHSATPVIVVPEGFRTREINKVYFACDFANLSAEMAKVTELCAELKADLEIYHYDYLLHVEENKKKLEKRISKYLNKKTSVFFKRQEIETPLSEHFEADIAKTKPAMVVLFTKQNRNWFDRLFLSSESAEMAFHAKVPLLTFKKKTN